MALPNHGRERVQIAMLFAGGPDNREALAYASRMAGVAHVHLTIVQFAHREEAKRVLRSCDESVDYEYMRKFQFKTMRNESITCVERKVDFEEEMVRAVQKICGCGGYDLCIVGKGRGVPSPLTSGLSEGREIECQELGPIGEALFTSEFAKDASILVIEQYNKHR